jgi:phage tail tape-measure protein
MCVAKKSMISEAADAAKSVAGAALGAAAVAATGVVVKRVAGAIRNSGKQLDDVTPGLQKLAGDTVSKPLLPTKQKRAAAKRTAKVAKKKSAKKSVKKKRALRPVEIQDSL